MAASRAMALACSFVPLLSLLVVRTRAKARLEKLTEFFRLAPKAELHLHLEGTLEIEFANQLAAEKSQMLITKPFVFTCLADFLDEYFARMQVLVTEDDFYRLAIAYFQRAREDGVVRAEVFFDPQAHVKRGVPEKNIMNGLTKACQFAERSLGIEARLILCFLRDLSEEQAFDVLHRFLPLRNSYWIGIGLSSYERGNPPEKFARVYAECKQLGFHLVAHGGEEGTYENVSKAIDVLGTTRIDHGVASVQSPVLLKRLAKERIPLTVCPLSNICLKVFDDLSHHVLPVLLDYSVMAMINSDDPAYFGGYLLDNFVALFRALPTLGPKHAYQLARNSVDATYADETSKQKWIRELDQLYQVYYGRLEY